MDIGRRVGDYAEFQRRRLYRLAKHPDSLELKTPTRTPDNAPFLLGEPGSDTCKLSYLMVRTIMIGGTHHQVGRWVRRQCAPKVGVFGYDVGRQWYRKGDEHPRHSDLRSAHRRRRPTWTSSLSLTY
jgi:hypothetical protein